MKMGKVDRSVSIVIGLSTFFAWTHGFSLPNPHKLSITGKYSRKQLETRQSLTKHFLSQDADANDVERSKESKNVSGTSTVEQSSKVMSEAESLRLQARRVRLEADKLEATLTLQKLTDLEKQLVKAISSGETRDDLKTQIELLAKKMDPSFVPQYSTQSSAPSQAKNGAVSTIGKAENLVPDMTPTELFEAYGAFLRLPIQMQVALAEAVNYDIRGTALTKEMADEILQKLNQQQKNLLADPRALQRIYKNVLEKENSAIKKGKLEINLSGAKTEEELQQELTSILADAGIELSDDRTSRFMESSYPNPTRKEGASPTQEEADYFLREILDSKNVFNPISNPEKIPGGYLIRGTNQMKEGENLVEAIDKKFMTSKLAEKYNFFHVRDPTPEALDDMDDFFGKPVILLMGRDMSPETNVLLKSTVSSLSLFLTFLFIIGTFATNDIIVNRLSEANAVGDYNIDWFNELVAPLLVPIIGTQFAHEAAHFIVSKRDDVSKSNVFLVHDWCWILC